MVDRCSKNLNVLLTATNFPDKYYPYLAPWSKMQADSIFKSGINLEVIVPRPYVVPLTGFPYNNFYKLPLREKSDTGYIIHYPRFFYVAPKKVFFGLTGEIYSHMVGKYILNTIDAKNIDVVHSRFVYLDGYGALNVCKKRNIPLVVDIHGSRDFGEFLNNRLLKYKQIKTLSYAEKILCVAKWQIEVGIKQGIPEEKLEYMPLGVDIDKFDLNNRKLLKQKNGFEENTKIILFVGQLIKRKGLEYLISAIPYIISKHKNVKFVIIGSGPNRKNLIKMCSQKKISRFVDLKGGIPEETLLEYYVIADIFVLPSLSEGQPIVVYEAMASENAIIGTNVGGIPEQVEADFNGYLIPPKDSESIAAKICFLLENPEVCTKMGSNSRKKLIKNGWTWESYGNRMKKIYNELN